MSPKQSQKQRKSRKKKEHGGKRSKKVGNAKNSENDQVFWFLFCHSKRKCRCSFVFLFPPIPLRRIVIVPSHFCASVCSSVCPSVWYRVCPWLWVPFPMERMVIPVAIWVQLRQYGHTHPARCRTFIHTHFPGVGAGTRRHTETYKYTKCRLRHTATHTHTYTHTSKNHFFK